METLKMLLEITGGSLSHGAGGWTLEVGPRVWNLDGTPDEFARWVLETLWADAWRPILCGEDA